LSLYRFVFWKKGNIPTSPLNCFGALFFIFEDEVDVKAEHIAPLKRHYTSKSKATKLLPVDTLK
jgi:hypothetical protein